MTKLEKWRAGGRCARDGEGVVRDERRPGSGGLWATALGQSCLEVSECAREDPAAAAAGCVTREDAMFNQPSSSIS